MKLSKKDKLVIIIPLVIVGILYPILPDKIPIQFQLGGAIKYMVKEVIFIFGLLPFILYRYKAIKKK